MNTNTNEIALPEQRVPVKALTYSDQAVFAHCAGFSCLAYRDRDGVWRSVFGNRRLPEILEFEK